MKVGLQEIPPLTFAGLRYTGAFLVLLPFVLANPARRAEIRGMARGDWLRLVLQGLIYYTATQGFSFVALAQLQATTLSLMLNFTSVIVAVLGIFLLAEGLTAFQWVGMLVYLTGAAVYFYPFRSGEPMEGLLVGGVVVAANAVSSLLGREINRSHRLSPFAVTFTSMGAGSLTLLALGIWTQGLPRLDGQSWAIIGWLAVVNSALAFTLWNLTQRTLTATESSIINNTMLIQVAILAWVFLGEQLTVLEIFGLVLAGSGILLVQLKTLKRKKRSSLDGSRLV